MCEVCVYVFLHILKEREERKESQKKGKTGGRDMRMMRRTMSERDGGKTAERWTMKVKTDISLSLSCV
jgi:hypothetical protein